MKGDFYFGLPSIATFTLGIYLKCANDITLIFLITWSPATIFICCLGGVNIRRIKVSSRKNWSVADKLKNEEFKRQEFWSKAMAVGDEKWLKSQASLIGAKKFKIVKSGKFIRPLENSSRYRLYFNILY